jgi:hypothetical protein
VKRTLPQKVPGDRRYYNEDVGVLRTVGGKKVHNNYEWSCGIMRSVMRVWGAEAVGDHSLWMLRPFLKCFKELDLNDAAATRPVEVKCPKPPGPSKGLGVLDMQQQPLFRSNGCKVSR